MSRETFEKTGVFRGIECIYKGEKYLVKAIDFEEGLIAFSIIGNEELSWVRCENCEYANPTPSNG
jgi:hypothetical protein